MANTSKPWTEQEKAILRNTWPKGTLIAQKALPHRSIKALQNMAKKLYVEVKRKRRTTPGVQRSWTTYELEFLMENYETLGRMKCAKQLQRTHTSVSCKANSLGLIDQTHLEPETDPWAAQPPSQVTSKSWQCEIPTAPRWVFDLANHI